MDPSDQVEVPQTLGQWRNPPLAYVVAELAISPHYGMAARIAPFQDALRSAFPRTVEATELVVAAQGIAPAAISATQATSQPLWQLTDAQQTRAVLITYRAIALHATAYIDSADFLQRWIGVLKAVEAAGMEFFVERAGLRYIDLIVPTAEREPVDYLAASLHGVDPLPDGKIQSRSTGARYLIDDVTVQLRTAAPAPLEMVFPPNFNALPLRQPDILARASERVKNQKPIGWIDTDAGSATPQPFDAHKIGALYGKLHHAVSGTFKAILSEYAKREWT